MEKILIVFRMRSHNVRFYEALLARNIKAEITASPRSLKLPCTIAVSIPYFEYNHMLTVLDRNIYSSLIGMYKVTVIRGRESIIPI